MTTPLFYYVAALRAITEGLRQQVAERYPEGSVVRVDNPRFHGVGIVVTSDECPADKLPVLVESGNIWWYEVETITGRVTSMKTWPRWIVDTKLRWGFQKAQGNARAIETENVLRGLSSRKQKI